MAASAFEGLFLPGVPGDRIAARFAAAPGNEVASGKFANPESSACLAANAFGFYLERPADLPELPGLMGGWPPFRVEPETELRFPWGHGRHPWLDVVIETPAVLIGVESKRYEPFRVGKRQVFADTYLRPVWGESMGRYSAIRDAVRSGDMVFASLDAAQLVKHAYALRTAINRDDSDKAAVLFYLYAEPEDWPDGRRVSSASQAAHRAEIARFNDLVAGDEVTFLSCSYRTLLRTWLDSPNAAVRQHAEAVAARFRV